MVYQSYHKTVMPGKLNQAVHRATCREEVGCLLPDNQCTKTGRPVSEILQENQPDTRVPPVENSTYTAFEEYEEVLKTAPQEFM